MTIRTRFTAALATAALAVAASAVAQQQDRGVADAPKRAADRIRALQREADELLARERTLLEELRKLEIDRQLKVEELGKVEREAAETEKRLAATAKRLATLRQTA